MKAAPGAAVTLAYVSMAGQGDTAVRVNGAEPDLIEQTITEGGRNGLVVVGSPAFRAAGLTWPMTGGAAGLACDLAFRAEGLACFPASRDLIETEGLKATYILLRGAPL